MRFWRAALLVLCLLPRPLGGEAFCAPLPAAGPKPSLHLYDRTGRPLRAFLSAQETYQEPVSLSELSPWLILAVLAAEDRRFYSHGGIDLRAMARAAWQNIRAGRVVSGASTVTQQLMRARRHYPKNAWGKLAEAWAALRWERTHSKDEILQDYLNTLQFGNLTQGVAAASRFYFGVDAQELSLAQAAALAGLIQSPTRLNPLKNPHGVLLRRGRVLDAMRAQDFITPEQYGLAMKEPLALSAGERPFAAPHFARRVQALAPAALQVHTTLDPDLQQYTEKAIQNHLGKLAGHNVTNAAAVVLDNATGEVLAYAGSADFGDEEHSGQVDGVMALRQPGSALKPFVYALALQNGLTAASVLQDEDTFFEGGFRPRNYDEKFHGGVSVRRALACSYNVPAVKAAEPLGAARLLNLLHELGFSSLQRPADFYGLGLALGGGEVTLLELANAYATLARGGRVRPVVFARQPRLVWPVQERQALPEETAYIITDILADNAARADAFGLNSPLHFAFPAAAKTGTSKDYKDNFAIGYTPRLTVAVWAGNFDASSMQKVSGISGAAPILHDVLTYAYKKYPSGGFEVPQRVVHAVVCEESGRLAGAHCPHTREEVFVQGQLPPQVCDGKHSPKTGPLQIIAPVEGDVFKWDESLPAAAQQLHFKTSAAGGPCHWRLDGQELPGQAPDLWWPLKQGRHGLSVACGAETARVHFTVL